MALPSLSRRQILVGGGTGVGLLLAWAVWPRHYGHNLIAAPGQEIFNEFLKIDERGIVTVIVGQAEMGQGVYTALPQILADELGADWRTIAVEPAPINPLYANDFAVRDGLEKAFPASLHGVADAMGVQIARRMDLMITGGSTSIRGFADRYRAAGATARALLCMAAAKRWDADWQACDTSDGFVTRGEPGPQQDRARFGELAAEAAAFTPPKDIPLRPAASRRLVKTSVPRLDLPSKVDGTAQYALDVRLPGMMFASVRHPPLAGGTLKAADAVAAKKRPGVRAVVTEPTFVACVADTWWAAEQGVNAAAPAWQDVPTGISSADIKRRLQSALKEGGGTRVAERGDVDGAFDGVQVLGATYHVGFAPHAAIEPMNATARYENERLEIWMPTQAPASARALIAAATDLPEDRVTIHPMLIGGGFGRKVESEPAIEAALISIRTGHPVQLIWSRTTDLQRTRARPPAIGQMRARIEPHSGVPTAWQARIATPSTTNELTARLMPGALTRSAIGKPNAGDLEGGMPGYAIPSAAIEHFPVDVGIETGAWRSVGNSITAFFNECFIDELAHRANMDPMSYRMQLLGENPRLAQCLSLAATHGGWEGGVAGSGQGIACHSCFGSHVAIVAKVHVGDDQRVVVDKITAAVDCGQVIHPDIVRQQIEGGIIWGIAGALGNSLTFANGAVEQQNFDGLMLPQLADTPDIAVHIIPSVAASGGVGEIAVPPVAPALANALFATTGRRLRSLPLHG